MGVLSDISASPFHVHQCKGDLGLTGCVPQVFEAIEASAKRPYQPHTLVGFHASQLLAYLAVASTPDELLSYKETWAQCSQLLNSFDSIPGHLGPLLTFQALSSPCKETLDFLAMCMNPERLGVNWSTRAEALLALDRLLSRYSGTTECKSILPRMLWSLAYRGVLFFSLSPNRRPSPPSN